MIKLNEINNVYTISLGNKPVNALSLEFVSELSLLLKEISNQEDSRGVIFSSSLKHFCAGADLKERSKMSDEESINTVYTLKSLFFDLYNLPFPTLSLINGACLGGGLELALACDFRLAAEDAIFGLPETTLGIIPGAGGTQLLPRLIGSQEAKKMIFSGKKIDSKKALHIGLIDELCHAKDLGKSGVNLMSTFTSNSKAAIKSAKVSINEGLSLDIKSSLNVEFREYIKTLDTKERKDALKKYVDS